METESNRFGRYDKRVFSPAPARFSVTRKALPLGVRWSCFLKAMWQDCTGGVLAAGTVSALAATGLVWYGLHIEDVRLTIGVSFFYLPFPFCAYLAFISFGGEYTETLAKAVGIPLEATVTNKSKEVEKSHDKVYGTSSKTPKCKDQYWVFHTVEYTYHFEGTTYDGAYPISTARLFDKLTVGGTIPILILPHRPHESTVREGSLRRRQVKTRTKAGGVSRKC